LYTDFGELAGTGIFDALGGWGEVGHPSILAHAGGGYRNLAAAEIPCGHGP